LGVRRLKEFNLALFGKRYWMMLEERGSLWHRVLCARYGEDEGRLQLGGGGGSIWWQQLNSTKEGVGLLDGGWLDDNIVRVVGDGSSTLF